MSSNFNSTIYLLKTMRQIGFNKKVLAGVYKSLISSQIASNATILCSTSEQAKKEMQSMQKRALRAMNINENQCKKLSIVPTEDLISKRCTEQMQQLLNNSDHSITKALRKRTTNVTRSKFEFNIERCRTERHMNTFVPKYLRELERTGFMTNEMKKKEAEASATIPDATLMTQVAKKRTECPLCHNHFITGTGIATHLRSCKKLAGSTTHNTTSISATHR